MSCEMFVCGLAALLIVGSFSSGAEAVQTANYTRHVRVMIGFDFYWSVAGSGNNRTLNFVLAVENTQGWIGFGIGEPNSGSMPGADMVIATIESDALIVRDYFSTGFVTPTLDCNITSDWIGKGYSRNTTHTLVELSRPFIAQTETHDRSINETSRPTRLVFAYGSTTTLGYHGALNRRAISLYLTSSPYPTLDSLKLDSDVSVARWYHNNFTVPAQDTTYALGPCFQAPALRSGASPLLVGFNVYAQPGNERFLHHMVVKAYRTSSTCGLFASSIDIWAVASAHVPFIFPGNIAVNLSQFRSFAVEIHYDNPTRVANVADSSGVDM